MLAYIEGQKNVSEIFTVWLL